MGIFHETTGTWQQDADLFEMVRKQRTHMEISETDEQEQESSKD